ncbi:MAG: hypothetical protein AB1918_15910 [Pseudomonadota bacterium]
MANDEGWDFCVAEEPPALAKCDCCGGQFGRAERTDFFDPIWVMTLCTVCYPPHDDEN